MSASLLIKNGLVMDGAGQPAARADVMVRGDRVEAVGLFPEARADRVIDASGLVAAPGFIDVHTHLDFFLPSPRHPYVLESFARQGVTTVVAGNCGFSPAPIMPAAAEAISAYWNFALPHDGLEYRWTGMAEYLAFLEKNGLGFNAAILTGHNTLRAVVTGFQARPAGDNEAAAMGRLLRESLAAGSIGFSVGLTYAPGIYSDTGELVRVAAALTESGAPLVAHTRGFSGDYDKAVEELIWVAERNRIPLHISHHAGGGGGEKGRAVRARMNHAVAGARERGVAIGHDNEPWLAIATTLLTLLPPFLFEGGLDSFFARIADRDIRARAIEEMKHFVPEWPYWEHNWWTDKFFSTSNRLWGFRSERNRELEDLTIGDIAARRGQDPYNAVFDLVLEERGRVFSMAGLFDDPKADDITARLLADPDCSIATDIIGADFRTTNPVAYGAFPRVLGYFARDRGVMTQEEAVRRMTSLPARQMRLKDRGALHKGAFADITVFNAGTVNNRASFARPYQFAEGIEYVLINGRVVLERGVYHGDALAGKVIRLS